MTPQKTTMGDNAPGEEVEVFDAEGALSRAFLRQRGFCCGNGCKNCPYGFDSERDEEGEN
ncbi:hypothetical protein B1R32_106135 [Abditibacterium utsteinense]|uniref:Uncharacterized protein n=1 Tax=Abditibacterium utsteinense TaxID=1960156 RepID=A0A2S8SU59_9BACT|nr:DUF5522 domain-containing protein [Abditibacterium utsteinense]PQV64289.1 hypothetical protein B1R32_106135 [Abditibacterium utsteinense]